MLYNFTSETWVDYRLIFAEKWMIIGGIGFFCTIFAAWIILKGDLSMNTITIDTDTYKAAEAYAKSRNVSIDAFVERLLVRIVSRSERKKKGNIIFLPK